MSNLSPHFTLHEMSCPCCGDYKYNRRLVDALEKLRHKAGDVPIKVNSAYRCPGWNAKVGGVPGSQHLKGAAADIVVQGLEPIEVAELADSIPQFRHGGIGVYENFVHLDVRCGAARWKG